MRQGSRLTLLRRMQSSWRAGLRMGSVADSCGAGRRVVDPIVCGQLWSMADSCGADRSNCMQYATTVEWTLRQTAVE